MNSYAAFHHFTTRPEISASDAFAGRLCRQLDISAQSGELSGVDESARYLLTQIVEHPAFDTQFQYILKYLELPSLVWNKYASLRGDFQARTYLRAIQPQIWSTPSEDVWLMIVQLRQQIAFPSLQSCILTFLKNTRNQAPNLTSNQAASPIQTFYGSCSQTSAVSTPPSFLIPQNYGEEVAQTQKWMQNTRPQSHRPRSMSSHTSASRPMIAPNGLRHTQAPEGMLYHCPSQNCKMAYKRPGHYFNHLRDVHPDFGPQHPDHSLQDTLRAESPSKCTKSKSVRSSSFTMPVSPTKSSRNSAQTRLSVSHGGSQASFSPPGSSALTSTTVSHEEPQSFVGQAVFQVYNNWNGSYESDLCYTGGAMMALMPPTSESGYNELNELNVFQPSVPGSSRST